LKENEGGWVEKQPINENVSIQRGKSAVAFRVLERFADKKDGLIILINKAAMVIKKGTRGLPDRLKPRSEQQGP